LVNSAGFGTFLQRKTTNTAPTTLSATQAASPSTYIKIHNYTPIWLAGMTKISS
jgi:hypothetical protein